METLRNTLVQYPMLSTALQLCGVLVAVWAVDLLSQQVLLRLAVGVMRRSEVKWDDALLERRAIHRALRLPPAIAAYYGIAFVQGVPPGVVTVARNVTVAYAVVMIARAIMGALWALNDRYELRPRARSRPIKGYIQIAEMVLVIVTGILVAAVLFEQSPLLLLSGLGAMTAVLMLVFKDTLLSLVASVQLASNDMLRVGDWIEMPQLGADGDVIDIALHTVKVQNWDKTITTIPTWRLIGESFKNWRGMREFGGRRIKRSLYLDLASARFLEDAEVQALRRFALLVPHLDRKREELAEWNRTLLAQGVASVNARRLTNLGCFRAYALAYLQHHPGIDPDKLMIVRQLQPGEHGLPLEIYCFTRSVAWVEYEGVQSDVFDHLIAILPEFGLRLYQQPSGADLLQMAGAPRVSPIVGPRS